MNTTRNEEGKQADNSYPMFLGPSETQGTELSTLTVDTAISSPPKYTNTKRPATPSSVSTTSTPFVKSRRIGLSTAIMPTAAAQFISNDDKRAQFAEFVRKPHEEASKVFKLIPPPSSNTSDNWMYFHLVEYYKDSPKELHNQHHSDCEYACCNICGTTIVWKKIQKGGKFRATGAGLKSHLESVHKIYKENNDRSKSKQNSTIPDQFGQLEAPKYLNKEEKQKYINDATIKWIIKECLPIDTTESVPYQNMMKAAYHGYKNISNKQIKEKLYLMATKVRRQIKVLIGKNTVSMTSLEWWTNTCTYKKW